MLVFTLPSYDLVLKVIRDRFPPPKTATRREVMKKYELVFRHDRAGRLVDAASSSTCASTAAASPSRSSSTCAPRPRRASRSARTRWC